MADTKNENAALILSVVGIVGIVVLNIFGSDVPEYVNFTLAGAILGASWEDLIKWLSRK